MRTLLTLLTILLTSALIQGTERVEVSVLTCRPGSIIYELEGHAGLRVVVTDSVTGVVESDMVYDWGVFDFDAPNFVYRFVKGETDYSIGVRPTERFIGYYAWQDRMVVEQKLNLTETEKETLLHLLDVNLLPENRIYRYNYVKDNCSTRIVEMLERAVAGTVELAPSQLPTTTFRQAMRHYHFNYPWYQFGIDLALGAPLDRSVPDRAMSFSPEALERMLAGAARPDSLPLVVQILPLTNPIKTSAVEASTPFWRTPMACSLLILLLAVVLTFRDLRRKRLSRWFDSVLFSLFGLTGLVLTFLIFVSVHEATSPNYLYLWLNPACFIVAIGVWVKKAKKLVYCYQIVNFVLLLALCGVFLAGVQSANAAFYPLLAADAMRSLLYIYLTKCQHLNRQ